MHCAKTRASIYRVLTTSLNATPPADLENPGLLGRFLTVIRDEGMFPKLVETILNDPTHLASTAALSYQHANGFTKLVLARGDNWALRLHVHATETTHHAEHIHDHRWPFASLILRGTLTEQRFVSSFASGTPLASELRSRSASGLAAHFGSPSVPAPTSSAVPCLRFDYCPTDDDFAAQAEASPVLHHLQPSHIEHHPVGSVYTMETGALHALICGCRSSDYQEAEAGAPSARWSSELPTVLSLVLTGRPIATTCRLFSRVDRAPEVRTPKKKLTIADVREILLNECSAFGEVN